MVNYPVDIVISKLTENGMRSIINTLTFSDAGFSFSLIR
jgi:hypothetical protein